MFIRHDTIVVYLKDLGVADQSQSLLTLHLRDRRMFVPRNRPLNFVFRLGKYDFSELLLIKASMTRHVPVDVSVMVDVDERINRVTIGVDRSKPGGKETIEALIQKLGLPSAAIVVREVERPVRATLLTDGVRPITGGLSIFSNGSCTLGFNVLGGAFVTASHCSLIQGSVDSVEVQQPYQGTIGIETRDPPYPRYSDTNLITYLSGIPNVFQIAKTADWGSLLITGYYHVAGKVPDPYSGEQINKVGQTTGWTWGEVTISCTDYIQDTGKMLYCQSYVYGGIPGGGPIAAPGDSGSPVFYVIGSEAYIAGIVHSVSGSDVFIFSPMGGIERDLGSLVVN